jgi:MinD-like ATPase involved in chromosome partitioning or flagellar assembly
MTAMDTDTRASVVTVYSWAGGTGRTQTVASLGVLLAARGMRVGILDASLSAPGLHALFGLSPAAAPLSLADYLFRDNEIETVGYDVSWAVGPVRSARASLSLIPGWISGADQLVHALARHLDLGLLADGIERLARVCGLDVLLIDAQNGVHGSAVVALLAADLQLLLVTGSAGEQEGLTTLGPLVAGPEHAMLVLSGPARAAAEVQQVRGVPVATALPYTPELERLGRARPFVHAHPHHPLTRRLTELADRIQHMTGRAWPGDHPLLTG